MVARNLREVKLVYKKPTNMKSSATEWFYMIQSTLLTQIIMIIISVSLSKPFEEVLLKVWHRRRLPIARRREREDGEPKERETEAERERERERKVRTTVKGVLVFLLA